MNWILFTTCFFIAAVAGFLAGYNSKEDCVYPKNEHELKSYQEPIGCPYRIKFDGPFVSCIEIDKKGNEQLLIMRQWRDLK